MKRSFVVLVVVVIAMAILLPLSFNTPAVQAQEDYSIDRVDHQVEVMYSGHAIFREKIQITGQLIGDFLIGFPYKYGAQVLEGMAYDEDNNVFPLSLGVKAGEQTGFYFAKITFPEVAPQVFTVVFVLSNSLLSQESAGNVFTLEFPAYPTLSKDVGLCNVEIVLPETPPIITVTKDDGQVSSDTYSKSNLPAFTYSPASVTFSIPSGGLQIIDIKELARQVTISPTGDIISSDKYRITNNSPSTVGYITIGVPREASNVIVRDEFGRILTTSTLSIRGNTRYFNVTLTSSMSTDASAMLRAEYTLPSVSSTSPFALNFELFPDFNYYVETAEVTFIPPEGARFLSPQISSIDSSTSLIRETFQEILSVRREGVSKINFEVLSGEFLDVKYDYSSLWLSFRPTVWIWVLAVVGCVVVVIWKRPKTSAPLRIATTEASVSLSPENVRAFIDAYDEKSRLAFELEMLETRAQKGKIPRRRYKVQKRTLEGRLENISKNISGLKKLFRSAGGNYANLVRQLDVAEAELLKVETNTRDIEVRHRKGALPLDAYKKAEAEYKRRREKAEAAINGILLRLREETR